MASKDVYWLLRTWFGNKDVFRKFNRYYIVQRVNILIIINIDKTWITKQLCLAMMAMHIQETRSLQKERRSLLKERKGYRGFKKFATYAMVGKKCGV